MGTRGRHRKTCAACGRQFYLIGKLPEVMDNRCDGCRRNGILPMKSIAEIMPPIETKPAEGMDDRVGLIDSNGRHVTARDYMVRLMKRGV